MIQNEQQSDFPVFKGLQRPLEFLGFQGRYIYWAAGTAGGAIVLFIIGYISFGFIVALVAATVTLAAGGITTFIKQRNGLHTKAIDKGIYVFAHSRHI